MINENPIEHLVNSLNLKKKFNINKELEKIFEDFKDFLIKKKEIVFEMREFFQYVNLESFKEFIDAQKNTPQCLTESTISFKDFRDIMYIVENKKQREKLYKLISNISNINLYSENQQKKLIVNLIKVCEFFSKKSLANCFTEFKKLANSPEEEKNLFITKNFLEKIRIFDFQDEIVYEDFLYIGELFNNEEFQNIMIKYFASGAPLNQKNKTLFGNYNENFSKLIFEEYKDFDFFQKFVDFVRMKKGIYFEDEDVFIYTDPEIIESFCEKFELYFQAQGIITNLEYKEKEEWKKLVKLREDLESFKKNKDILLFEEEKIINNIKSIMININMNDININDIISATRFLTKKSLQSLVYELNNKESIISESQSLVYESDNQKVLHDLEGLLKGKNIPFSEKHKEVFKNAKIVNLLKNFVSDSTLNKNLNKNNDDQNLSLQTTRLELTTTNSNAAIGDSLSL